MKTAAGELELAAAKRQLHKLDLLNTVLPMLESTLQEIDSAYDLRHLELVMAEAGGLLRGLLHGQVLTPEQGTKVQVLFDAVASHEKARMRPREPMTDIQMGKVRQVREISHATEANKLLVAGWVLLGVAHGVDEMKFPIARYTLGWVKEGPAQQPA